MHTPQRFHSVTGKMGITYEAYVVFLSWAFPLDCNNS
jgi:hypothetical protein